MLRLFATWVLRYAAYT